MLQHILRLKLFNISYNKIIYGQYLYVSLLIYKFYTVFKNICRTTCTYFIKMSRLVFENRVKLA